MSHESNDIRKLMGKYVGIRKDFLCSINRLSMQFAI